MMKNAYRIILVNLLNGQIMLDINLALHVKAAVRLKAARISIWQNLYRSCGNLSNTELVFSDIM